MSVLIIIMKHVSLRIADPIKEENILPCANPNSACYLRNNSMGHTSSAARDLFKTLTHIVFESKGKFVLNDDDDEKLWLA